ncbi:MAG TPA: bifunctional DNA-formamidopyrimidine glycosylase/DNA-(apurinic or apyrimidinic site) lyase [Spirochaetota bacterium]|nr:bifunctional DNA-formamidopyrimidine glycosylase/DNA-(apurinic or apyrimidinic site) lyase [Spirochaetota bacterium]
MPELPEVQTIVNGMRKEIINTSIKKITVFYSKVIKGSVKYFKQHTENNRITALKRHGKYIFIELANAYTIIVHLRMTGQLFTAPLEYQPDKHTHLEIILNNSKQKIVYRDTRIFGRFELIPGCDKKAYIKVKKLAPDALTMTSVTFRKKLENRKKNIKACLLDQSVIAGLGNIYTDEVLLQEKIDPYFPAGRLDSDRVKGLLKTIKKTLKKAIAAQGTTVSDYVNSYGAHGTFQLKLRAYKQKDNPCPHCRTPIQKTKLAGRGTYYCPQCQSGS